MPDFANRLKELVGENSANSFARRVGIGESLLRKYLSGTLPSIDNAQKIAAAANCSFLWLATGEGSREITGEPSSTEPVASQADVFDIPRLDVRASAGHGALAVKEEAVDFVPFPATWIKAKGLNPASLRIVDVAGDSMEPTLANGDIILVDTAARRIVKESLYVIVRDEEIFVKRAQKRMNGSILIASDNERYPPEELTEKDAEKLHVAGRVVWFGRSI